MNECELLAGLSVEFKSIDEKRAIPTCIEAVNNDPNNIKYWLFLGRSYDKAKQFEKSLYWYKKASDQGDFVAQNNLATLYYNGNGVEKDYKEAFKLYKLSADQDFDYAQYNLATFYYNGNGVEKDYKEAFKLYKLSADQGFDPAQNSLGDLYYYGEGVEQDYKEAMKWYLLAAEQGNDAAQNNIGYMYSNGQGVEQDYKEAMKWYLLAAEQGNADAQNIIGYVYSEGEGVEQDYKEAMKWYLLAAQQENLIAQYQLGTMYYNAIGVKQDYKEAMKWFQLAAEQGDADAQIYLGILYYNGKGVEQDYKEAMKWYQLAAEQGSPKAYFNIGQLYNLGKGVEQDYNEATKWFIKVIENKYTNSETLTKLSLTLYTMNEYELSMKANKRAVELGNMYAINNMGEFYEHGDAVKRDLNKAFDYYAQASGYGELYGYYNLARHHFLGLNKNSNYEQALRLINNALHVDKTEKRKLIRFLKDFKYLIINKKDVFNNYKDSFLYLKNFASQGNAMASLLLADYYTFQGEYVEALQWYNIVSMYEKYLNENNYDDHEKFHTGGKSDSAIKRISKKVSSDKMQRINLNKNTLFSNWLSKAVEYKKNNILITQNDEKNLADIDQEYLEKKELLKNREYKYWDNIDFHDIEQIKLYKIRYPNGDFIQEADLKIKRLLDKTSKNSINKKIFWGNYHALIIGNDNYNYLPKLRNAINDAKAVHDLLKTKFNFNSTLIKDADRNKILDAIYKLRNISENDNILIYYSGHGVLDKASETAYWQPIDAEMNRPGSWINEYELKAELKAIKAKHVMIVADSCFSGALLRGVNTGDFKKLSKKELIERNLKKRIRMAFTSGGEEPVLDSGGGKHSVFAKSFLDVMKQISEPVEGRYIFNRVSEKLVLNTNQQPQYNPILNSGGERNGDFVFIPKSE